MRKVILFLVICMAVAGCASKGQIAPMHWDKPGATQDDFSKDNYSCLQESQQRLMDMNLDAASGIASERVITNGVLFDACMKAKGWNVHNQPQQAQEQLAIPDAKYTSHAVVESAQPPKKGFWKGFGDFFVALILAKAGASS